MDQADRPALEHRQPGRADRAVQVLDQRQAARRPRRLSAAAADPLFRFVQLEFAWPLGPDDGRYLLRPEPEAEPDHVIVLSTLGAPQRRLLGRRKARDAPPEPEPEPVATARATVIPARPLEGPAAGEAWLQAGEEDVEEAVAALNRALHAHRLAAADPYVHEVSAAQALAVRVGYGRGDQVAEGRWVAARDLPPARAGRRRRVAALRPQERLAAILGAREAILACEELALRARLDLDMGRTREAALGLRVALEAALVELDAERSATRDMPERLADLRGRRGPVGEAANAALRGPLSPEQAAEMAEALERLTAALRARAAAGPPVG